MRILSVAAVGLLFSGCVTASVITLPKCTIDFKQYKTVKVVMRDEVDTS